MQESIDIKPRNDLQLAVMTLLANEMGGDRKAAGETYAQKYAQYFDIVLNECKTASPEKLLAALHEKFDSTHH